MATKSGHQRAARREDCLARIATRKAERMRRRQAIREGLALWHAELQKERARRPTMAQAAAAGIPITFTARGGLQFAFRFGQEVRAPGGIAFRPAVSAELLLPNGEVRSLLPRGAEEA